MIMKLLFSILLVLIVNLKSGVSGVENEWENINKVNQKTETLSNITSFGMNWTLRNFSYIKLGDHYTPYFSVPKLPDVLWYLNFYYYSSTWYYFRLHRRTATGKNSVRYRVSLIDLNGNPYKLVETGMISFAGTTYATSTSFLSNSVLIDPKNNLYNATKDTLRIRFEMQTVTATWNVDGNSSFKIDIPVCDFGQESAKLIISSMRYGNTVLRFDDNQTSLAAVSILAYKSRVFDELFTASLPKNMTEIKISNIDSNVFNILLRNIYTGECELVQTLEKSIFLAVKRFGLEYLQAKCELELSKLVSFDNAVEWLQFARQSNASQLQQFILNYVRLNSANQNTAEWLAVVKSLD